MRKLCVIMATLMMILVVHNTVLAASGSAVTAYQSNLSPGACHNITFILSDMGYSSQMRPNITKSDFLSFLEEKTVIHSLSHGSSSSIQLYDGSLTIAQIQNFYTSIHGVKFVFLEACSAGPVAREIWELGALCAMGFGTEITAPTSPANAGIHYYAQLLFEHAQSNNIVNSAAYAQSTIYASTGYFWGSDSAQIYGGATSIY